MTELHINSPEIQIWCTFCGLSHSDCICSFDDMSFSSNLDFPNSTAVPDFYFNANDLSLNTLQYRGDSPTSESGSAPSYNSSSEPTPTFSVRQMSVLSEDTTDSQTAMYGSDQSNSPPRKRPKRGAMTREEAHAVRLIDSSLVI